MKFFKKIFKGFKKVFKKIGKTLKKGFGKLAKAFGKLGPLGSIALNFMVGFVTAGAGSIFMKGLTTALGKSSVGRFILGVGAKIKQAAMYVKKGIGSVFNRISDGIELGLNTVSKPFMKAGSRGIGSAFRDFVSKATKGFIDPSKQGNIFDEGLGLKTADGKLLSSLSRDELAALPDTQLADFTSTANRATLPGSVGEGQVMIDAPDVGTASPAVSTTPLDVSTTPLDVSTTPAVGPSPVAPAAEKSLYESAVGLSAKGEVVLRPIRELQAEEDRLKQEHAYRVEAAEESNRERGMVLARGMLAGSAANALSYNPNITFYNLNDFQQGQGTIDPNSYDYGVNAYHEAISMNA